MNRPSIRERAMMRCAFGIIVLVSAMLLGCSPKASRTEFVRKDVQCLRCYCASNAVIAEAALLDLVEYAERCQQESVSGILYDQVLGRAYARLFLVEEQMGKRQAAEWSYGKALEHYQRAGLSRGRTNLMVGRVREVVEMMADPNLSVAWRRELSDSREAETAGPTRGGEEDPNHPAGPATRKMASGSF